MERGANHTLMKSDIFGIHTRARTDDLHSSLNNGKSLSGSEMGRQPQIHTHSSHTQAPVSKFTQREMPNHLFMPTNYVVTNECEKALKHVRKINCENYG